MPSEMIPLKELNEATSGTFIERLVGIFEDASWVASRAVHRRPFGSVADLFRTMREAVEGAQAGEILGLLRGHPELAISGAMSAESVREQNAVGLDSLSIRHREMFERLNKAYRAKFDFPFILCIRRHGQESILREFERRLGLPADQEMKTAVAEVLRIAALRLDQRVSGPDRLPVSGRLTTHVLDTAEGRPAVGLEIELAELVSDSGRPVARLTTNADGRTDTPLIGDRPIPIARYELRFHLGAYFRSRGFRLPEPAFLDIVPVRFGVGEPEAHYHVPLLASPWSYSTYRGS